MGPHVPEWHNRSGLEPRTRTTLASVRVALSVVKPPRGDGRVVSSPRPRGLVSPSMDR